MENVSEGSLLRPVWRRLLGQPAWVLCLACYGVLGALRVVGTLGQSSGRLALIAGFVIMWCLPFLVYSRTGRQRSGLTKIDRPVWLVVGPILGVLSAWVIHIIGFGLFGTSSDNWYVSVRTSYQADPRLLALPLLVQFLVFTAPAVIFSPLGEEFFFRGMLQVSLKERFGVRIATTGTALAFGFVHLLHHGVAVGESGLQLLPISGLLWVALMAGVSLLFALVRAKSGSIWPAVASHVAFNIGMNVAIFYLLP